MRDRPVLAGFGRVIVPADRIWFHFVAENGATEDEAVVSVGEAEALIAALQTLVDRRKAQLAPKGSA
ncbi:MAG: hypothetical protein ABIR65_01250 [Pseudolysinimonas sp.]